MTRCCVSKGAFPWRFLLVEDMKFSCRETSLPGSWSKPRLVFFEPLVWGISAVAAVAKNWLRCITSTFFIIFVCIPEISERSEHLGDVEACLQIHPFSWWSDDVSSSGATWGNHLSATGGGAWCWKHGPWWPRSKFESGKFLVQLDFVWYFSGITCWFFDIFCHFRKFPQTSACRGLRIGFGGGPGANRRRFGRRSHMGSWNLSGVLKVAGELEGFAGFGGKFRMCRMSGFWSFGGEGLRGSASCRRKFVPQPAVGEARNTSHLKGFGFLIFASSVFE